VLRTTRTLDLAIGERTAGPILRRHDGCRLDPRTAHRWVQSIGRKAGLEHVHPHMLRAAFIMAALDAGVPLRDVQLAACHADPRTTTVYDHRRQNFDRHAAYDSPAGPPARQRRMANVRWTDWTAAMRRSVFHDAGQSHHRRRLCHRIRGRTRIR
jgi:Phage integrase family